MTLPPTGKLVRDLIPEIIRKTGKRPETCMVSGDDYTEALRQKLGEEVLELQQASFTQISEEIADAYEVLLALTARLGMSWSDIEELAENKRIERGGFSGGVWLVGVSS